ncbi:SPW repeat domain-containing protein [Albidovulum sp.]|uniref:SPW repeat domain-containing protein n=1 Tax=Albidovulum sp. TaxID=1872424 RepID=UPI001DFB8337|nr:hypothetical protein [Paracoccaceae bacterium]MCC0045845.1 hypothetical protein [Defluviimonas sp.]HPE24676.1 hypothetical protein [Albidovulum sp.]MCB2120566.1 hypothetical protein [Paracoccaceae bacterium]MCB2122354.1 hypothetical protein [Paracoccaceae bacterium]
MRFVTRTIHAWLDYPVALALIILPFLLELGASHPAALALSPVIGVAALVLTLFTDHATGVVRLLPYRLHLAVDLVVGLLFLVVPFALGFSGVDAAYYLLNGSAVVAVIALSKPETGLATA